MFNVKKKTECALRRQKMLCLLQLRLLVVLAHSCHAHSFMPTEDSCNYDHLIGACSFNEAEEVRLYCKRERFYSEFRRVDKENLT